MTMRHDRSTPGQARPQRTPANNKRHRGRPKTGSVETWARKNGDVGFGVRFIDQHGIRRYERCGLASEGWSRRRAEIELENFERLVAAGVYRPTPDAVPTEERDPIFGAFARAFLAEHAIEVKPNTRDLDENLLEHHLAPVFDRMRLSQITWSAVDAYKKQRLMVMQRIRAARASGKILRDWNNRPLKLSERTINMSIGLLAMILDEAVRRPDIDLAANPARDKKLRVKVPKKNVRDWLEPDEVITLLEAAEQVDSPVRPETERRAREVRRLRDEKRLTIKQIAQQLKMSEGGIIVAIALEWKTTHRRSLSWIFSLPRCPAPNTSVIYSDESSQQAIHFCVFGGLYFWCPNKDCVNEIAKLESGLGALKAEYGLRLVKWEDVPTPSRKIGGL